MYTKHPLRLITIISLGLMSCSKPLSIDGLDSEKWQSDKDGCGFLRFEYLKLIYKGQDELLNRTQNDIEGVFGLPDEHQLDQRSRKIFYYYLEPGPECHEDVLHPVRLQIKFNAVGLSSEVFLENY